MANTNTKMDVLEQLVDGMGMAQVLDALAEVASAKSDHLLSNWQDEGQAERWDKVAAVLLNAEQKTRDVMNGRA